MNPSKIRNLLGTAGLGLVLAFGVACGCSNAAPGGGGRPGNAKSSDIRNGGNWIPPDAALDPKTGDLVVHQGQDDETRYHSYGMVTEINPLDGTSTSYWP